MRGLADRGKTVLVSSHILAEVDQVGDPPAHITQALAAHGQYLDELVPVRADLESVFLELTAGRGPGTHAPPPEGEHRPAHHAEEAS